MEQLGADYRDIPWGINSDFDQAPLGPVHSDRGNGFSVSITEYKGLSRVSIKAQHDGNLLLVKWIQLNAYYSGKRYLSSLA